MFALLKIARTIAISAGDFSLTKTASKYTIERYEIDPYEVEKQTVIGFSRQIQRVNNPINVHGFGSLAMRVLYNAAVRDEYSIAKGCLAAMQDVSSKGDRSVSPVVIRTLTKEIDTAEDRYRGIVPFVEALSNDPNDADAAVKVGSYLCFVKGNWSEGLPMLENSSNALLQQAARAETLVSGGGSLSDAVKAGDAWWKASTDLGDGSAARLCRGRAVYWYNKVSSQLGGTLDGLRVKSRLQNASDSNTADNLLASIEQAARDSGIK